MPSYDFMCSRKECDWEKTMTFPTIEEYSAFMVNPRMRECPTCYKETVIRQYTPIEFRFEGGKPSDGV